MWLSSGFQNISKSPPGKVTLHFLSVRPVKTPATTTEQAPVPQARVGPAPLSQTLTLTCSRETT